VNALAAPAPRRRRRGLRRLIVLLVILVVVIGLAIAADVAARAFAQDYVEQQIEQSLPAGVQSDVDVRIGGGSMLLQLVTGKLDDVHIDGEDLTVGGLPVSATVALGGVPLDQSLPAETALARIVLTDDALDAVLAAQGDTGTTTIRDGRVLYTGTAPVLGVDLDFEVTADATADEDSLHLEPTSARVTSGPLDVDATALIGLVAPNGIDYCVGDYLPVGVAITRLDVGDGSVTLTLAGDGIVLNSAALSTMRGC
jgi:hypothetical protein